MDESTSLLTKGCFARVAVKIDSSKPLVPDCDVVFEGLDLPVFWQTFEYEHLHLFCYRCARVGHLTFHYKFPPPTSALTISNPDVDMDSSTSYVRVDYDNAALLPWIHRRRGGPRRQSSSGGFKSQASARDLTRAA